MHSLLIAIIKSVFNWKIPSGIFGIHILNSQYCVLSSIISFLNMHNAQTVHKLLNVLVKFNVAYNETNALIKFLHENKVEQYMFSFDSSELDTQILVDVDDLHPLVDRTIQQLLFVLNDKLSETDRREINKSLELRKRLIDINTQYDFRSAFTRVLKIQSNSDMSIITDDIDDLY